MLPADSIDLTVTSPPYDKLRTYNGFTFDFETIARELFRVTKLGGVIVWIVGDATVDGTETGSSFKQALFFKDIGFNLHDTMIWNKGSFSAVGGLASRYASVFEYMFVFSKGAPKKFNPIKDRHNKWAGTKGHGTLRNPNGSMKSCSNPGKLIAAFGQRHNIWEQAPSKSHRGPAHHPAMYPEQLIVDHITSWSNPGDIVFDPFIGSGTTALAALKAGRRFLGFEISAEYVALAKKRIEGESKC